MIAPHEVPPHGRLSDVSAPDNWRAWRPRAEEPLATFDHANASFVTPYLAVGGDLETTAPDVATGQLEELGDAGITHVIDVRLEWSDEKWVQERNADVGYLHLGIEDAGQRVPDGWFDADRRWGSQFFSPLGGTPARRWTPFTLHGPSRSSRTPRTRCAGTTPRTRLRLSPIYVAFASGA